MKRFIKAAICLLLVISTVAVCAPLYTGASYESDKKSYETQIKNKKNELTRLKNEAAKLKSEKANQILIKMNLENQLLVLEEEMITTQNLIAAYEAEAEVMKTRRVNLQMQTEKNYQNFKETLRYNYMYGQYTDFELLFSGDSLFDFLSDDEYSHRIFNYDNKLLEDLDSGNKELTELKKELDGMIAEEENCRTEIEGMQTELDSTKTEIDNVITEIESELKKNSDLQDKADKDILAMDQKVKAIIKAMEAESRGTYVGGSMLFPIPLSAYSRCSSYYGYRTHPVTGKKMSFHTGIDLPAAKGTPIYAANSGTVILAEYSGGYGNCVMINHGGGIVTLYGHASKLNCKKGDKVTRGDVVAYVGTTGSSTGNHLHFEVRVNGNHVDPIKNGYVVLPKK